MRLPRPCVIHMYSTSFCRQPHRKAPPPPRAAAQFSSPAQGTLSLSVHVQHKSNIDHVLPCAICMYCPSLFVDWCIGKHRPLYPPPRRGVPPPSQCISPHRPGRCIDSIIAGIEQASMRGAVPPSCLMCLPSGDAHLLISSFHSQLTHSKHWLSV